MNRAAGWLFVGCVAVVLVVLQLESFTATVDVRLTRPGGRPVDSARSNSTNRLLQARQRFVENFRQLVLVQPEKNCSLTNNWGNRPLHSDVAKRLHHNQQQAKVARSWVHLNSGMGSDLHTFSHGLCYGMEHNISIWIQKDWIWTDAKLCARANQTAHPMACYFGDKMRPLPTTPNITSRVTLAAPCGDTYHSIGTSVFRAQAMEYMFTNVSHELIANASRVLSEMVGQTGLGCQRFRQSLFTVHIRWGDKSREMGLQPVTKYAQAVHEMAIQNVVTSPVLFLTTEDRQAYRRLAELINATEAYRHWRLFTYEPAIASDPMGNVPPPESARSTDGGMGSASLVSLLVALEAQYYVLTTRSNWSRVINELRQTVRDVGCGNCTRMRDLVQGEWRRR